MNGVCVAIGAVVQGAPEVESRTVQCLADGTAIFEGHRLTDSRCDDAVPRCTLLVEGGVTGPYPYVAYENQVRQVGSTVWVNLGFWCPQSTAPVPVPTAQDIRDQVIRLLPSVPAVTTGANTLVNIQTLLWADTDPHRDLGRVSVVGQPVWLRLAFDHADWDFGDGATATATQPGKAYDRTGDPCRTVSCPHYFGHTYTAPGPVTVTVRVAWRASFSLDGSAFLPVDDAPLTGPPATAHIRVRAARGVLVAPPGD